jgi:FAD/FMN-containing dehydrogenase
MTTTAREPLRRTRTVPGLVLPGDDGWDEARRPWNLAVDQHPAAVVLAESADDVVAAVRFARDAGLRIAPQGTGHGAGPMGPLDDTLLLRTSRMREVTIDATARRARAAAGAVWEQVVAPASPLGLAALHGSSPDVGVVGYSLGGGMGWLARRLGLATNSVTAVELVTADGELVRADASHDPDLFWAVRGGGGNFGVVTAIEFTLYPLRSVFAGWLVWPWEASAEVLAAWSAWTELVPEQVTSNVKLLQLPPLEFIPEPFRGRDLVVVSAALIGDAGAGGELLWPLRRLRPELDTFQEMPPIGLARLAGDPEGPTPIVGTGALLDDLPQAAIDAWLGAAGPGSGSRLLVAEMRHMGGALRRPAPGGGALSHVDAGYALFSAGIPMDAADAAAVADRAALVAGSVAPWGSGRSYLNFTETRADSRSVFTPEAHRRIAAIRERLDPDRRLRPNHPITPPAPGA